MACEVTASGSETKTVTTEEYRLLFNTLSDSIQDIERIVERLKNAQIAAEELYMGGAAPKEPLIFMPRQDFCAVK